MIYQCYFAESQRARLFNSPLYTGFGLYSNVNPQVTRNCPELTEEVQARLSEYVAMIHLWRNPELVTDSWIGFTSYRQLDKFSTVFTSRGEIEKLLGAAEVVGWGGYRFFDGPTRRPISLAEEAERQHPGLNSSLWRMLIRGNEPMPNSYLVDNTGLFCNYWLMSRQNFNAYMEWSFPLVRWCLANPDNYMRAEPRAMAFLVERLFICWYGLKQKKAIQVGALVDWFRPNPYEPPAPAPESFPALISWHASLQELTVRHRFSPRGIVHVGAHYAEERESYRKAGAKEVLWIEADPAHLPQLQANIAGFPGHRALQACLSNVDGQTTSFFRTDNQGESSSILPMGTHRQEMSYIHVVEQTLLKTTTFAALAAKGSINLDLYDTLVMDVQGAELLALQGLGELLRRFDVVYLEVNLKHLYAGCALLPEIDSYLRGFRFERRETLITQHNYGDALYLRTGRFDALQGDLAARLHQTHADVVARQTYTYRVAGGGERPIQFMQTGQIGHGKGPLENAWLVRIAGHEILLEIIGDYGRTCYLTRGANGNWSGHAVLPPFPEVALIAR